MPDMAADFNRFDAVRKTAPLAVPIALSAASLSSSGGESQGEEVVYLSYHAGRIETATRWKVAMDRRRVCPQPKHLVTET